MIIKKEAKGHFKTSQAHLGPKHKIHKLHEPTNM
jgi:hypothetical protein